ncbi:e3 ubiquitin-protein ligase RNF13 [Trichonephila clavipes]|nr:e3 ubiquitin-protein ligase RNF13 [Trichonephila clavipes]
MKAGLRRSPRGLHTRTQLSPLLRLNRDSSLNMTWFHSAAVQFPCVRHHSKLNHRRVDFKGSTRNWRRDPKCPLSRFEKTQDPLVKVLHVPGWQVMKKLAVRMHFLRCGGHLDDWSVEGVMSLVFV